MCTVMIPNILRLRTSLARILISLLPRCYWLSSICVNRLSILNYYDVCWVTAGYTGTDDMASWILCIELPGIDQAGHCRRHINE